MVGHAPVGSLRLTMDLSVMPATAP
ncbi:uncharacterized protein G2W53_038346 [Senna tora]|uniref:Uncharacterized protein n=1 Tax=Senna tora TaxID=362788 RepID=A0A834SKR8_9FABA|nr:uncharacterized protein G2W53_038346 [Senna tora]